MVVCLRHVHLFSSSGGQGFLQGRGTFTCMHLVFWWDANVWLVFDTYKLQWNCVHAAWSWLSTVWRSWMSCSCQRCTCVVSHNMLLMLQMCTFFLFLDIVAHFTDFAHFSNGVAHFKKWTESFLVGYCSSEKHVSWNRVVIWIIRHQTGIVSCVENVG